MRPAEARRARFGDLKLGVLVHWGLYSVPGWAPAVGSIVDVLRDHYDDFMALAPCPQWYENALRLPHSPTAEHHRRQYGIRPYAYFRPAFEAAAQRWDPQEWAQIFHAAGARYAVLAAKHHDGYCLWPTRVDHPRREGWHAARDVCGDFARAVRGWGLRFGVFYSGGIDWSFNAMPARTPADLAASVPLDRDYCRMVEAHYRELVDHYRPDILWNDIAWPGSGRRLARLLDAYHAAVPGGVVNDRWHHPRLALRVLRAQPARRLADAWLRRAVRRRRAVGPPAFRGADFRTSTCAFPPGQPDRPWEHVRGIGRGLAWNRNEPEEALPDPADLVRLLVRVVAAGGNLLLAVGPDESGAIPEAQRRRLLALGRWLGRYGEAIYESRPAPVAAERTGDGTPVRFTRRGSTVYAILLKRPSADAVRLPGLARPPLRVRLPGAGEVSWKPAEGGLEIRPAAWPADPAIVLALDGVAEVGPLSPTGSRPAGALLPP